MKHQIPISVIMPVYNTEKEYLVQSIQSILNQTFIEFEFIIVDDGSDTKTKEVIRNFEDPRIKYITNECNQGLPKSLNIGIRNSHGKYIARMDSDDVSLPQRLQEQFLFMEEHPEVTISWTVAQVMNQKKYIGFMSERSREEAQVELIFDNLPVIHPTVIFRRDFLQQHHLEYSNCIVNTEDFEFWTRCIKYGKMQCLNKILLYYRIHEKQITTQDKKNVIARTDAICLKQFHDLIPNADNDIDQVFLAFRKYQDNIELDKLNELIRIMIYENKKIGLYDNKILQKRLLLYWIIIANKKLIHHKDFTIFFYKITYWVLFPNYMYYVYHYKIKEKRLEKMIGDK